MKVKNTILYLFTSFLIVSAIFGGCSLEVDSNNNENTESIVLSSDIEEKKESEPKWFDFNYFSVINSGDSNGVSLQFEFEELTIENLNIYVNDKEHEMNCAAYEENSSQFKITMDILPKEELFSISFRNNDGEIISVLNNVYITEKTFIPNECQILFLIGNQSSIELNFESLNLIGIYADCSVFDIKDIKQMSNLEYIDITHCWHSYGTDEDLMNFTNLKVLKVKELDVNSKLDYLENLQRLHVFGLGGETEDGLNYLFNLEILDIDYVQIYNFDISNLEKLKYVKLGFNPGFNFDLNNVKDAEQLHTILLSGVRGELESLSEMYKLEELDLIFFKGTGNIKSLSDLTNLKHINISEGVNVQGSLNDLKNLNNLEVLIIENTSIEELGDLEAFPNLKELYLENNSIMQGELDAVKRLCNLETLRLEDNYDFTGNLNSLYGLVNLKNLYLIDCVEIYGDLSFLISTPKIEKIYLENMDNITAEIGDFSNHEELKDISISNCSNIKGDIREMYELPALEYIKLYSIDIEGDIVALNSFTNLYDVWIFESENLYGDISTLDSLINLEFLFIRQCPDLTGELLLSNNSLYVVGDGEQ